jgi:tetratricopeptide (TPR) repeat protein
VVSKLNEGGVSSRNRRGALPVTADPNDASAHNDRGQALAEQGLLDQAIEEYQHADKLWQKEASKNRKFALCNWANALREQEHYEQAAEKCQEAIGLDPEFPDAYNSLGQVRAAQECFDEAIQQYRRADALWQNEGSNDRKRALCKWAEALTGQGHHEQAAEKCQEAISLDPEFPDAYNSLGLARARQGRFDEAIEQCRQADALWQKRKPKDRKQALWYWAIILREQEHYEQAADKCQQAIGLDPEFADAYHALGLVRAAQGRFDEAIEEYRRAEALWQKKGSKNRKFALCRWADVLSEQEHYDQAAEKCQEAIGIDPHDPLGYMHVGDIRAAQERFDDAIDQFRQADALWQKKGSKNRKFALCRWAYALREQRHYEQAAEKCQEAIGLDPEFPDAYHAFGWVRAAQEHFDGAIEQFRQADELWRIKGSKDRKRALWSWGWVLGQQEKFEDAKIKFDCAREIVKDDALAVCLCGDSLIDLGQYQDAIAQFDKASALDRDDPRPCHYKASILFRLGHYEEGWKEWWAARQCYERALDGELRGAEHLKKAVDFAGVLGEVFESYEDADKLYKRVIERQDGNAEAWAGRAILNQQWANSDAKKPAEIHARLSYLVRRASELLKRQLGKGMSFQTYLALANLYIESYDWTQAREQLDLAESVCGGSRLKRARVTALRGLICYHMGQYAEAVKNLRQALLVRPDLLSLRSNLGNALLRLRQFETAKHEFSRVLKDAPGNIDALCGAAQVHIELADDGDPDQYEIAVQYLTEALAHGRDQETGSRRLQPSELANIYYARGYARTKSYEADASRTRSIKSLEPALNDFQKCKELDPIHCKARAAIEKINKRRSQHTSELLVEVWGPGFIFCFSVVVFLVAQLVFIKEASLYVSLTFGSLLFMIAAVYLPQLLKLKLPGFELEKASLDRVSGLAIGISRSESLISTRCRSLTD